MTRRSAAIVVFVKTPGFSPTKTRLAAGLGSHGSEEFYRLSIAATEATVAESAVRTGARPYWAVAEEAGMNHLLWQRFERVAQGGGGLGNRLHRVLTELQERHSAVVAIGADSPQMTATLLESALSNLMAGDGCVAHVLGRCFDGGFYLVGSNRRLPFSTWCEVTYSTETTAEQLAANLRLHGKLFELPRLTDVDHAQDLAVLREELQSIRSPTAEQSAVLSWIEFTLPGELRFSPPRI